MLIAAQLYSLSFMEVYGEPEKEPFVFEGYGCWLCGWHGKRPEVKKNYYYHRACPCCGVWLEMGVFR